MAKLAPSLDQNINLINNINFINLLRQPVFV